MLVKEVSLILLVVFATRTISAQEYFADGSSARKIRTHGSSIIKGPKSDPLSMPSDAAVGKDGSLYVVDGTQNRIVIFNAQGSMLSSFGSRGTSNGKFNHPLGITAGSDGTLYIADTGNRRIQVFSPAGKFIRAIPLPVKTNTKLPDITDVAITPDRNTLYMVDNENHVIRVYDLNGKKFTGTWGSPGKGRLQFRFPFMIAVNPDGYVLVVETVNTRVQAMNPSGKFVSFIGAWGVGLGQFFRPKGVAVYHKMIFVSDSYLGSIQVFNLRGKCLGILSSNDNKPLHFITPTGLAIDQKRKRLFVVELKANRIRCVNLD